MIGEDNADSTSNSNDDIREYLPKKYLDFNTAINSLGGDYCILKVVRLDIPSRVLIIIKKIK